MQIKSTLHFQGVIVGPVQPMVDRSLSLHLCKLHQNPLSSESEEDAEQPAIARSKTMGCYWEMRGRREETQRPAGQAGSREGWYSERRKKRKRGNSTTSLRCLFAPHIASEQRGAMCVCVRVFTGGLPQLERRWDNGLVHLHAVRTADFLLRVSSNAALIYADDGRVWIRADLWYLGPIPIHALLG